MPRFTVALGILLTLLGVIGFFATGMASWTALIPTFFGVPMWVLGVLARKPQYRKQAMHVAAGLAALGVLGTARGAVSFTKLLTGGEVGRPAAVIVQTAMAVVCLIFLVFCVKSFIDARRKLNQQPT